MRLSTAVTLALAALLVTSLLGVALAAPVAALGAEPESGTVSGADPPHESPSLSSLESGQVPEPSLTTTSNETPLPSAEPFQVIRINVSDDGDARWTIESRFVVSEEADEELLVEHADSVSSGDREVGYDVAQFEPFVDSAAGATDREMTLENAGWNAPHFEDPPEDADLDDDARIGVISYSFTWTNLATIDDGRIYFGDAFQSSAGTNIDLVDGQRLVIESPPNYGLETPTQLTWDGPHQFEDGDLEIVFLRGHVPDTGGSSPVVPAAGAVVALLVVGYLFYRFGRMSSGDGILPQSSRSEPSAAESELEETVTPAGENGGNEVASERPTAGGDDTPAGTSIEYQEELEEDVDLELLSDEERVHRLLKQNGGRLKQATIVKETGWSNAKVSQLLSQMDDDEEIDKLRIGRENLITLPEVDPTEVE
ncbi:hypothetical protein EA462_11770 [Natrarchaeobius halalkaliphilus]|uniref:Transmembrane glycoprotein / HTH domain protein n=1 Tax=Natrarchaeobius halalkaliphilus TaxID=1679091 RepID=A0A3N6LKG0_9EURY|nr:hypothetical protein [Natrarchaeobius halalkaliphilus]RQG89283.1 hypothetical protein EA462_11770 [Natrarchaeobius halalkaliphilus]